MNEQEKLQALLAASNTTTGETDTTLTDAVQRLVDGYGGGGGEVYYSSDKYGAIYTENTVFPDRVTANRDWLSSLYDSCTNMKTLYVGKNYKLSTAMFYGCTNLRMAKIRSIAISDMFWACGALEFCTIYPDVDSVKAYTFEGCNSLIGVIVLGDSVMPMDNTSAFSLSACRVGGTGRIYVPKALLDAYKSATNWSSFASNILSIEDNLGVVGDYL